MNFSEFLKAINENQLASLLENAEVSNPLFSNLKETFIKHLKDYFFVREMPEVVKTFAATHDYDEVRTVQN